MSLNPELKYEANDLAGIVRLVRETRTGVAIGITVQADPKGGALNVEGITAYLHTKGLHVQIVQPDLLTKPYYMEILRA